MSNVKEQTVGKAIVRFLTTDEFKNERNAKLVKMAKEFTKENTRSSKN